MPYDANNQSMLHDYNHVTEKGVALVSSNRITFNLLNDARVAVFGENSGGYIFEAPTVIASSGLLHIAYWSKGDLLAEEPLKCGATVDILQGVAKVYICDRQHFVIIFDTESNFTVGLLEGGVAEGEGGGAKAATAVLNRVKASQAAAGAGGR